MADSTSASVSLRLLAFMVPTVVTVFGVQPLIAGLTGSVRLEWGARLAVPCVFAAAFCMLTAWFTDRGRAKPPPWSAYALLPGSFLLAGASAMGIFGAFVEFERIAFACWTLLAAGTISWVGGLVWVRRAARAR
jgi:hypothetical protein